MMMNSRGSITLGFLGVCFFVAAVTQLMLYYTMEEHEHVCRYLQEKQLRLLCASAMEAKMPEADAQKFIVQEMFKGSFAPVAVTRNKEQSEDGMFEYLVARSAAADNKSAVQRLRKLSLSFPDSFAVWAGKYALVSKNVITGGEHLPEGTLYTSGQKIIVPRINFLTDRSVSAISATGLTAEGFSKQFYYLPQRDSIFSFPVKAVVKGEACVSTHGHFIVGAESVFPDRIIMIADAGNIEIKESVKMLQALIIAAGEVSIAEGCEIKGLILANRVSVKGRAILQADEKVVAPFSSIAFL